MQRKEFASGVLGNQAWELISSGATCEAMVEGRACGKPGIGTTDFDVIGDAEQKVHCSQVHHLLIAEGVTRDLTAQGRSTVFGINGFGRGEA